MQKKHLSVRPMWFGAENNLNNFSMRKILLPYHNWILHHQPDEVCPLGGVNLEARTTERISFSYFWALGVALSMLQRQVSPFGWRLVSPFGWRLGLALFSDFRFIYVYHDHPQLAFCPVGFKFLVPEGGSLLLTEVNSAS